MPWIKDLQTRIAGTFLLQPGRMHSTLLQGRQGDQRRAERQVNELIGLMKGMMADGAVQQNELEFLLKWLEASPDLLDRWPARAIYPRLKSALTQGAPAVRDQEEIRALFAAAITDHPETAYARSVIEIPFTDPVPDIEFGNRLFCFTGNLQSGSKSWCDRQVLARGGASTSTIDRKLHYLIVGNMDDDWFRAQQGRKILRAIKHIQVGANIAILRERHWLEQLR